MINNVLELLCLEASGDCTFVFHQPVFKKSNIDWPQQPPKEKVLKFNIFHNSNKKYFFQNIKIKLSFRTWMTLKSSVVIFQTIEPQQPQ